MKIIFIILMSAIISCMGSGCCSYMVYKNSEKNVTYRRAVASGDEKAIKAVQLGNGGAGVGIDITALDALKENPIGQAIAAIIDALSVWGLKAGADYLNKNNKEEKDAGNSNNTTVNVTVQDNTESDVDIDVNVDASEKKDTTSTDKH